MEEHKRRVVKTIQYKEAVADKKTEKIYTVKVQFLEIPEPEAKMKLEMIKSIMKRGYLQKGFDPDVENKAKRSI